MAQNSTIEWTDHTFNPVRGCTKISPGCANCYAAREARRFPAIRGTWGDSGTRIVAVPSAWKEPLKWDRAASRAGTRARVFCASLADIFEDWKGDLHFPAQLEPGGRVTARWDGRQLVREIDASADRQGLAPATMDHLRAELFALILATPHLDWLLLTKRPENWREAVTRALAIIQEIPGAFTLDTEPNARAWMLQNWLDGHPPRNVWIGTTAEDQQRADQRIPALLSIPARVRFLSCEPLLGPVDLAAIPRPTEFHQSPHGWDAWLAKRIHWLIAGGESGPGARPMHPEWARSLRDQCQSAGVPFLFKQWGEFSPGWHESLLDAPAKAGGWTCMTVLSSTDKRREGGQTVYAHDSQGRAIRMDRPGKKAAGRLLDGREWNEFPVPA